MKRVLIVESSALPKIFIDEIRNNITGIEIVSCFDNKESIINSLNNINGLIGCPRPLFSKDLLESAGDSLEWIHVPGAGIEEFLIEKFVNSDIVLTNGKIIQGPEVSDHALALLLSLTRNIGLVTKGVAYKDMPRPIELRGKKALVVGVGGIGHLIAEKAAAFGMTVFGVDENLIPMTSYINKIVSPEEIDILLPEVDVVFNATPVTQKTIKMFDKKMFLNMKKTSYFINISRGKIVDTDGLLEVVSSGHLSGVGLDVTDPEPLPENHGLHKLNNVIITPHIAGPSDFNRQRSQEVVYNNIKRYSTSQPLINVINKRLGY